MQVIEIGRLYRHYKGNIYRIVALATDSETLDDVIVYSSIKDGKTWVRPYSMWNEIVDNKGTLRFTLIDED